MLGILTLTHNCLELTKNAIHSFLRQDVPVAVKAIDNGSTDGSYAWLHSYDFLLHRFSGNNGVSEGWNEGINWFFQRNFSHVLVVGNDTWLPPYFARELMSYQLPFVTGVAVDNMDQIQKVPNKCALDPHPDFSAFLISRQCWQAVGPFDTRMKLYASDCDWHIRAHRLGIQLWKASCEFYHERSSTMRNASPEDREAILAQANRDRSEFYLLYGCLPGTREYEEIFEQNFSRTVPVLESSGNTQDTGMAPASGNLSTGVGASPSASEWNQAYGGPAHETFEPAPESTPGRLLGSKRP